MKFFHTERLRASGSQGMAVSHSHYQKFKGSNNSTEMFEILERCKQPKSICGQSSWPPTV